MNGIELQDREFFAAIREGREPNASVAQVLPCYQVLHDLEQQLVGGHSATASTFLAMGMSSSNSGFVGYPIMLLTLAPMAGVVLALNMLVENLVVIPLLLWLAERAKGTGDPWRALTQSLVRLATNPLFLALAAGLVISATGWQLPAPVTRSIDLLASASGALSLFVIGGTLVGLPLAGMGQRVMPVVLGKLLVHPLLVWGAVSALPWLGLDLSPELRMAAVLSAAMPVMGIYPTLAQAHGQEDTSAAALMATTMASFFTLSTLLWLFNTARTAGG
jgi:malonate transporter